MALGKEKYYNLYYNFLNIFSHALTTYAILFEAINCSIYANFLFGYMLNKHKNNSIL